MSDRTDGRAFARLVVAVSIVANVLAVLVVQGERALQPYAVASTLDRFGLTLSDQVEAYGTSVTTLQERVRLEAQP